MDHEGQTRSLSGRVTEIFARRFVVETKNGRVLADLGPKGAELVALREGDKVDLIGDMKPSELKVRSIATNGGQQIFVEHPKKPRHPPREVMEADRKLAAETARANGLTLFSETRRKPKHVEVLGRDASGGLVELHIELDGALRKTKPIHKNDPKWATEIGVGR